MTTEIKVGDLLAIPIRSSSWSFCPNITNKIVRVERLTKTQAVCGYVRIRLSDLCEVGGAGIFRRAVLATPEIIELNKSEAAMQKRYFAAKKKVDRLEGHAVVEIRKLRIEQLEALGEAWEKILAM